MSDRPDYIVHIKIAIELNFINQNRAKCQNKLNSRAAKAIWRYALDLQHIFLPSYLAWHSSDTPRGLAKQKETKFLCHHVSKTRC